MQITFDIGTKPVFHLRCSLCPAHVHSDGNFWLCSNVRRRPISTLDLLRGHPREMRPWILLQHPLSEKTDCMRQIVAVIFGLALLGNAALFVPQALAVWRKKTDEGISLVTFGGFCILQVIGVVHGFYEQDRSLIIGLGASFLTCGTVTLLTIVYRVRRLRNEPTRPVA
jgi:MtN3 and saliva related transmembrane protein